MTGHAAYERHANEPIVAHYLRVTTQPIPDLRHLGVPDNVCAEIERAMSTKPEDRPSTAAEFGNRLRRMQRLNGCPVDEMALITHREPHPTTESARPPLPDTAGEAIHSQPEPALTVVPTATGQGLSTSPGSEAICPQT